MKEYQYVGGYRHHGDVLQATKQRENVGDDVNDSSIQLNQVCSGMHTIRYTPIYKICDNAVGMCLFAIFNKML